MKPPFTNESAPDEYYEVRLSNELGKLVNESAAELELSPEALIEKAIREALSGGISPKSKKRGVGASRRSVFCAKLFIKS